MGATKSLLSYHHYIPDNSTGITSSIEGPMITNEASIPTEPERMTTLKRKVSTKTCVTKLTVANIKSSPDDYIPARKKPRLQVQASLPSIAADADTMNAYASPEVGIAVHVAVASADAGGTDPVADRPIQPHRAHPRRWTPEEVTKLTSAVNTTCPARRTISGSTGHSGLLFLRLFRVER
jgi:hypothetical protein